MYIYMDVLYVHKGGIQKWIYNMPRWIYDIHLGRYISVSKPGYIICPDGYIIITLHTCIIDVDGKMFF